jgi:pimeloyl-ACP methyl ester carboxylesterase
LWRLEREGRRGTFETGRYRGRYVSIGNGPPLIFIHGLADSLDTFVMPMALLSREFQCISYDQPTGHRDGARLWQYTPQHLVEDLFALMDQLGLREAAIVGHSFGSTTAVRAMHARPERISRAALLCGFARRPLSTWERWLAGLARYWFGTMKLMPLRRAATQRVHQPPFQDCNRDIWEFFVTQTGKPVIRAVAYWALHLHATDLSDLLPAIKPPVLVVCGDRDPLVPHSCQEHLFRKLPDPVLFQIRNCGHFPTFTHPTILADVFRRFFKPTPGAHAGHNGHVTCDARLNGHL